MEARNVLSQAIDRAPRNLLIYLTFAELLTEIGEFEAPVKLQARVASQSEHSVALQQLAV